MTDFPRTLLDGYRSFRATRLPVEQERYRALAEHGQDPDVMVIGCCDSRVSPEVIFDAAPGELFVVRNVANLVPPYSPSALLHGVSAALEFAVQGLNVRHIVVLGHAGCGGIRAFVQQGRPLSPGDFIGKWMSLVAPAAAAVVPGGTPEDYLMRVEQASVAQTLGNLMTFPWVKQRVEGRALALHGAYFDVATGELTARDPASGEFCPLDDGK